LPENKKSRVSDADLKFIKRALKLAEGGRGYVSPNPLVGAVLVKDGKIVGEGYHQRYGEAHAEVNAIRAAGDESLGSTLYVTLEPCSHEGKTGPCTAKIYEAGISRVVIGMQDPNPIVNGKGINYLKSKGIAVDVGVMEEKCQELNAGYIKYITTGVPLITLKIAQTLDGRIATSTGHSKWITSEEARIMAHRFRAKHDAIVAGIDTIITDDPYLTVRYIKAVSPRRVILDSKLRVPLDANVLSEELAPRTIIVTTKDSSKEKIARIEEKGATVLVFDADDRGWAPLQELWKALAEIGITSVIVEGGSTVQTECLKNGDADRLILFIAPRILGSGIDAIGDLGIRNINSALALDDLSIRRLKTDLMITGKFKFDSIAG